MFDKSIKSNNLYYIRDSYVVEYKDADKKIRPYFCFAHNKNFALVFPITSQKGSTNITNKRILIPNKIWKGSKISYLQIYDVKYIPRNTPYKYSFKIEKEFSNFVKQNLIKRKRALIKIENIKTKYLKKKKNENKTNK